MFCHKEICFQTLLYQKRAATNAKAGDVFVLAALFCKRNGIVHVLTVGELMPCGHGGRVLARAPLEYGNYLCDVITTASGQRRPPGDSDDGHCDIHFYSSTKFIYVINDEV